MSSLCTTLNRAACAALLLLAPWLAGCQLLLGGVEVESVSQTTNRPGQVAVYVAVTEDGKPVTRLEAKHFQLKEDGTHLDPAQVGLTLLPRDSVAAHRVLVLVDMSGDIDEPGRRALLAKQLAPFVDRLRRKQDVSVYGFDGGEKLHALGKFEQGEPERGSKLPEFPKLLDQKQADSSSNLNGALLTAISQLDFELNQDPEPIKLGRIVVIARGPDLAGRTTKERLAERLDQIPHHVFALGVEKEPNVGYTEEVGRSGHVLATSGDNMESQLAELASLVEGDFEQYYLLSYCSPARSGQRLLLIEVTSSRGDGSEKSGSLEIQFSSDGFASGCDATQIPRFPGRRPAHRPAAPAPETDTAPDGTEPAVPEGTEPAAPDGTEPGEAPQAPGATDAADGEVPPPATPAYAE